MRKIALILVVLLFSIPVFAADAKTETKSDDISKWFLIGADVILAGLTVYTITDQMAAADDYETLKGEIDNTTSENYYRLLFEREKVVGKENMVLVSSIATGCAVLYTVADMLWLNKFFPKEVAMNYDFMKNETKLSYSIKY